MAMRVNTLDEDLIACQICFYEFDEETKKPKFLQCFHTICHDCFQILRRWDTITCPFCRTCTPKNNSNGVVWVLPTNQYVLELLRLNRTESKTVMASVPMRKPVERVDQQLMLAPDINSREIEETTSVATVIPNNREIAADDDEQLRLALEISNLQMEQEALKEAIFLRLLNQQQRVKRSRDGPKLRHRNSKRNSDCPRNRDPQTTGLDSANDVPYVVVLFGTFISFLRATILCLFTILPIVYVLFVAFSIAISN